MGDLSDPRLENVSLIDADPVGVGLALQYSAAISLKRIADALSGKHNGRRTRCQHGHDGVFIASPDKPDEVVFKPLGCSICGWT